MIAAVKSDVVAEPPMSAVLTLPALMTSKVAVAMLLAMESRLEGVRNMKRCSKVHTPSVSTSLWHSESWRQGWLYSYP